MKSGSTDRSKRSAAPSGGRARPAAAGSAKPSARKAATPSGESLPTRPMDRTHLLSLSFLRDGDEFMARLE
ncbi:MAG TPA: hypothetical protein VGV64_02030, partial [Thermoplasmata archaeon]|nr:hypothetical protein [Thermoplasmata archaeon]